MENAKRELVKHIRDRKIEYIKISYRGEHTPSFSMEGVLDEELLSRLDFEYDDGYGAQELFGCIWYIDGTWSERGEYDGSEWWEHKKRLSY